MIANLNDELKVLLQQNLSETEFSWLTNSIEDTKKAGTAKKLYLNYSLCGSKIAPNKITHLKSVSKQLGDYLLLQNATNQHMARIWLLHVVLKNKNQFLEPVKNLIQVADTVELETFLKYLVLLPNPESFQFAAVEALRTNIATVFDAISKHNPYPAIYFTDQQWNQMFLKAAFMQQDLGAISSIDERANADLARIISDYAHERWAASRDIDPLFWRPVSNFLEGVLVEDVKRLFSSTNERENKAAALVCHNSTLPVGKVLLNDHPELLSEIKKDLLSWQTL